MHPELFELPFVDLTVKSYGLMMVVGFLAAVTIIRYLSRDITPDPQMITNAALYSLVGGVVGARIFYVVHYFDHFRDRPLAVFAIWHGGLELLGGVILAVSIIFAYLLYHKLPIRKYLDILAIGLMLALVFGRVGCFLNGCCWGQPTDLPWGVHFPYNSFAYRSQVNPDPQRNRPEPYLDLPSDYVASVDPDGTIYPKPYEELTERQKTEVTKGRYRCLAVHPTQLYTSLSALGLTGVLYAFWRRSQRAEKTGRMNKWFVKPGQTFALMFIVYGSMRFLMELIRDDNPFGFNGLTVSQNIGLAMIVLGMLQMGLFAMMKPEPIRRRGETRCGQKPQSAVKKK